MSYHLAISRRKTSHELGSGRIEIKDYRTKSCIVICANSVLYFTPIMAVVATSEINCTWKFISVLLVLLVIFM